MENSHTLSEFQSKEDDVLQFDIIIGEHDIMAANLMKRFCTVWVKEGWCEPKILCINSEIAQEICTLEQRFLYSKSRPNLAKNLFLETL